MEQTERIAETHEYNIQPTANRKKNIQKNKANCYIFSAALIKLVIAKSFDCFLIIYFAIHYQNFLLSLEWLYDGYISSILSSLHSICLDESFHSSLRYCCVCLCWGESIYQTIGFSMNFSPLSSLMIDDDGGNYCFIFSLWFPLFLEWNILFSKSIL